MLLAASLYAATLWQSLAVLMWVKFIEAVVQLRPRAQWRTVAHRDARLRRAMRWYTGLGWRVWPAEIWNYWFRENRIHDGPTVRQFWGEPQSHEAKAMADAKPKRRAGILRQ